MTGEAHSGRMLAVAKTAAVAALILTSGPATAQNGRDATPPPAKVRVARAETRMMAPTIEIPGTVISRHDARVAAEIAGRVTWAAEAGTVLAEGEDIARLDDRMLTITLQDNEAEIKRLEARLRFLKRERERLSKLAASGNVPARRLDEAVSQHDQTEQELAQARTERERTLYNLERTHIRAPFAGRVVERLLEPGEYSAVGGVVARLVDTEHTEIRARVPVRAAAHLSDGAEVDVQDDQTSARARVRTVIPVGDAVTRTVEIRVENPDSRWLIGQAVRVAVPADKPREVVAIPRDALVLRAENVYVFKVNGEQKAERVAVRAGAGRGAFVEISGPVADGDMVVVRGAETLRDGQEVEVITTT